MIPSAAIKVFLEFGIAIKLNSVCNRIGNRSVIQFNDKKCCFRHEHYSAGFPSASTHEVRKFRQLLFVHCR